MNRCLFPCAGIAVWMVACASPAPESYTVVGTADSTLNGKTVYLCEYISQYGATKALDSTVIADNAFSFSGKADSAVLRTLKTGRRKFDLILENGNLAVDLVSPSGVVSGTPANDRLAAFKATADSLEKAFIAKRKTILKMENAAQRDSVLEAEWSALKKTYTAGVDSLIRAYPSDPFGLYAFWRWTDDVNPTPGRIDTMYRLTGDGIRNAALVKKIMSRVELLRKTEAGRPFIDFTAENMKGDSVSFSDYVGKGKYVLVDFWASWCGPCVAEIPNIAQVYKQYAGKDFEVVSVAVWDKKDETLKAVKEHKTSWPQIVNTQSVATGLYGIDAIPHLILFAPDGTIVARGLRGPAIGKTVAKMLNK